MIGLTVLLASGLILGGAFAFRHTDSQKEVKKADLIGGQKDEQGCLVAAGYSWCEEKQKCLRAWEEDCAVAVEPTQSDVDAIRQAFALKYQRNEKDIQVTIEKFDGNFARGGVKFAVLGQVGEGGIFLAYKDNDVWKLAFDGNGMISCPEMAELNFPEDMTLGCYNETGGEVKPTAQLPNPASVNCVNKGGKSEIRTGEDGGQYGVCIFPNGSECEEWALFRGDCERTD
jgi:putative hemolysin